MNNKFLNGLIENEREEPEAKEEVKVDEGQEDEKLSQRSLSMEDVSSPLERTQASNNNNG